MQEMSFSGARMGLRMMDALGIKRIVPSHNMGDFFFLVVHGHRPYHGTPQFCDSRTWQKVFICSSPLAVYRRGQGKRIGIFLLESLVYGERKRTGHERAHGGHLEGAGAKTGGIGQTRSPQGQSRRNRRSSSSFQVVESRGLTKSSYGEQRNI
jgi:hypothetical protein